MGICTECNEKETRINRKVCETCLRRAYRERKRVSAVEPSAVSAVSAVELSAVEPSAVSAVQADLDALRADLDALSEVVAKLKRKIERWEARTGTAW